MVEVFSDLKYYNANANGKNHPDCTRRSISLAYGRPYEQVALDSRRIASRMGMTYQDDLVMHRLLKQYGYEWQERYKALGFTSMPTVAEFAEEYSVGTYVVHCVNPKNPKSTTQHAVAVIDGTIYDSWDSQGWLCDEVTCVSESAADAFLESDINELVSELNDKLLPWIQRYARKKIPDIEVTTSTKCWDEYSGHIYVYLQYPDWLVEGPPKLRGNKGHKRFSVKINPTITYENNYQANYKRLQQQIRDYLWEALGTLMDVYNSYKLDVNKSFWGDRRLLAKIPKWAVPYVWQLWHNTESWADYPYSISMTPLENDNFNTSMVSFYAHSIKDLNAQLEEYRADCEESDEG